MSVPRHEPFPADRVYRPDELPEVHPAQGVLPLALPLTGVFSLPPLHDQIESCNSENTFTSKGIFGEATDRDLEASPGASKVPKDPHRGGRDGETTASGVPLGTTVGFAVPRYLGPAPTEGEDGTREGKTLSPQPVHNQANKAGSELSTHCVNTTSTERSSGPEAMLLLPEARPWAAAFIQAAMEVAQGLRPPTQLIRWTTPEVHGKLVRRGELTIRARRNGGNPGSKPRLRTLVLCSPKTGVHEVSAVVAEPPRVRAVAFRMEGLHGRWRVTELEMQGRLE
ncbi:hypothetical protein KIH74_34600, partial [Kineosporia sp. J2-2]